MIKIKIVIFVIFWYVPHINFVHLILIYYKQLDWQPYIVHYLCAGSYGTDFPWTACFWLITRWIIGVEHHLRGITYTTASTDICLSIIMQHSQLNKKDSYPESCKEDVQVCWQLCWDSSSSIVVIFYLI